MGLKTIPTLVDGSLGRNKSDVGPVPNLDHYWPAKEINEVRQALADLAAAVGLDDGSTPGSLEQVKRALNDPALSNKATFTIVDDFFAIDFGASKMWLSQSSGGGTVARVEASNSAAHEADSGIGLARLQAGIGAGDQGAMHGMAVLTPAHNPVLRVRFRPPSVFGSTNLKVGLSAPDQSSYARFRAGTNTNTWRIEATSAEALGFFSTNNLGTLTPDAWHELRIDLDPGVEARFYVDGSLLGTLSDGPSIPQGTDELGVWLGIEFEDANINAWVDWVDLRGDRL